MIVFFRTNIIRLNMNGLLIGRFQPFHLGHLDAIKFALSQVEKLWLGLGSSNKPIEKNNPFTSEERKEMILSSINSSLISRIKIFPIPDMEDHKKWIEKIDTIVPKYEIVFSNDELTEYLYSKRGTKVLRIPFTKRDVLSGTNIRDRIISDQKWEHLVPEGTRNFLNKINAKKRLEIL